MSATRPDAFLPDLASSLNNLGNTLSELGRRESALEPLRESARYYLGFARSYPEAFVNNLMIVLRNLVENLQATGANAESETVLVEAVQFLQSLQGNDSSPAPPQGE